MKEIQKKKKKKRYQKKSTKKYTLTEPTDIVGVNAHRAHKGISFSGTAAGVRIVLRKGREGHHL